MRGIAILAFLVLVMALLWSPNPVDQGIDHDVRWAVWDHGDSLFTTVNAIRGLHEDAQMTKYVHSVEEGRAFAHECYIEWACNYAVYPD